MFRYAPHGVTEIKPLRGYRQHRGLVYVAGCAQRFLAEGVVYRPAVGKCRHGTDGVLSVLSVVSLLT